MRTNERKPPSPPKPLERARVERVKPRPDQLLTTAISALTGEFYALEQLRSNLDSNPNALRDANLVSQRLERAIKSLISLEKSAREAKNEAASGLGGASDRELARQLLEGPLRDLIIDELRLTGWHVSPPGTMDAPLQDASQAVGMEAASMHDPEGGVFQKPEEFRGGKSVPSVARDPLPPNKKFPKKDPVEIDALQQDLTPPGRDVVILAKDGSVKVVGPASEVGPSGGASRPAQYVEPQVANPFRGGTK